MPYGRINDIKKLDGVVDVVLCQTYYTDSMGSATLGQALTAAEVAAYSNNTQYQGEGMLIGILDTGLDVNHEAFANAPAVQKLQKSSLSKLLYQISQGEDGKDQRHRLQLCRSVVCPEAQLQLPGAADRGRPV